MQRENQYSNSPLVVDIEGAALPVFPIVSLTELASGFYASLTNTCKRNLYAKSFFGVASQREIERDYVFEKIIPLLKVFYPDIDFKFLLSKLKEAFEDKESWNSDAYKFFDLLKKEDQRLVFNFVGKGDYDGSDIRPEKESDAMYVFLRSAGMEKLYDSHFYENSATIESSCKVLINNGSNAGHRHGLRSEKNIVRNMVKLFSERLLHKIEELSFIDELSFEVGGDGIFRFFDDGKENSNLVILVSIFDDKCDIVSMLRKFDEAGFDYAEQEKEVFISGLKEFILKEMNESEMVFNTNEQIYVSIDYDDVHKPLNNNQLVPVHFLLSVIYACVMGNMSAETELKMQMFDNIISLINELQKDEPNFSIDENLSALDFIIKYICGSECQLEMIKETAIKLFGVVNEADHVTQFEVLKLNEHDRIIENGFILKNSGVFVYPLQKIFDVLEVDFPESMRFEGELPCKLVSDFPRFEFRGFFEALGKQLPTMKPLIDPSTFVDENGVVEIPAMTFLSMLRERR